jgi:predicted  nucleic acid-binding Zn-ribbon protein
MSTLSQSTSQASSQAITQAAAQHERTLSENNALLSKISTMDKEINDLKDKLALLMEKLRDTDIKLKNSEEEQRKLKSMEPRSDLQQTIPTISSTLSSSSFSALSFSASNVVLAVPVVESTNLNFPSINQGHNSIGVISKQTEDNLAKATTTDPVSSQKIAAELGSEIERLRKQLLAANRDAAEMKNTVASLQKKKAFDKDLVKKGIQVFASTQTDFDLHQQVEVNPPKDKDASSIQTPLKTRKTSAAPSRVLPDVEKISNNTLLSLHPTYRVNIDGVKDPNASYSVVGTDTELVNLSHHTERSLNDSYSDRRVDDSPRILKLHAPKVEVLLKQTLMIAHFLQFLHQLH